MQCKKIKNHPEYFVFEDGTVISKKNYNVKTLRPFADKRGYQIIQLWENNKRCKTISLHRIVAEAFLPLIEGKTHVNHKDGIKENNHVSNLEWTTNSENNQHAYKHRLKPRKLNDEQVRFIKRSLEKGSHSASEMGRMFSVSATAIHHIRTGRSYKHIKP